MDFDLGDVGINVIATGDLNSGNDQVWHVKSLYPCHSITMKALETGKSLFAKAGGAGKLGLTTYQPVGI
jgi:hypothetical protein